MPYLTLLGSIIQSIAALMGIVSVILIFVVEQKLSMAIKILDNLYVKYISNELNSIVVKRILMVYVYKLDDIRFDLKICIILATFYTLSTLIIFICFLLLVEINNFYSLFISSISIFLILFFLIIVYNFGKAPYSDIFEKWSPESIMNEPQYKEVLGRYLGYFDREDILELYSNLKNNYLFCWDEIPGNDNKKLNFFLNQNYGIEWEKNAKIKKVNDNGIIEISMTKNISHLLELNNENTKVNLKIHDGRSEEFIVKKIKGKRNVYKKNRIHFKNKIIFIKKIGILKMLKCQINKGSTINGKNKRKW